MRSLLLALSSAVALSGCGLTYNWLPGAKPPAAAPVDATAPKTGRVLEGLVRYFGEAQGGAEVAVRRFQTGELLTTAVAGPDGRFRVILPEGLNPGAVLQVVGRKGERRVASLAKVPSERVLLQASLPTLILDEQQTAALMLLAPRILAALELGTEQALQAAVDSLNEAAEALGSENQVVLDPASFDAAVDQLLSQATDQFQRRPEVVDGFVANLPADAVEVLAREAEDLANSIRKAVLEEGKEKPRDELIDALSFEDEDVPKVFTQAEEEQIAQRDEAPGDPPQGPPAPPDDPEDPTVVIDLGASEPVPGTFAPVGEGIVGEAQ